MIELRELSPWLLVVAPLIVIVGYTVFGLSGFGATAITVPVLAHFLPVIYLLPMMAPGSIVTSVSISADGWTIAWVDTPVCPLHKCALTALG